MNLKVPLAGYFQNLARSLLFLTQRDLTKIMDIGEVASGLEHAQSFLGVSYRCIIFGLQIPVSVVLIHIQIDSEA